MSLCNGALAWFRFNLPRNWVMKWSLIMARSWEGLWEILQSLEDRALNACRSKWRVCLLVGERAWRECCKVCVLKVSFFCTMKKPRQEWDQNWWATVRNIILVEVRDNGLWIREKGGVKWADWRHCLWLTIKCAKWWVACWTGGTKVL